LKQLKALVTDLKRLKNSLNEVSTTSAALDGVNSSVFTPEEGTIVPGALLDLLSEEMFYICSPSENWEYLAVGSVKDFVAEDYYDLAQLTKKTNGFLFNPHRNMQHFQGDVLLKKDVLPNGDVLPYEGLLPKSDILSQESVDLNGGRNTGENGGQKNETNCELFGYISFPFESSEGIPYARFTLPKIIIKTESGVTTVKINSLSSDTRPHSQIYEDFLRSISQVLITSKSDESKIAQPGSFVKLLEIQDGEKDDFTAGINAIKEAIYTNQITKGVISRDRKIKFSGKFNFHSAVESLKAKYSGCAIIFTNYPGRNFIAVTPERLFSLHGNTISTEAVAATVRSSVNLSEQIHNEEELFASAKEINEHIIVRDYLVSHLDSVADNITFEAQPSFKRLANVTHLKTDITATLKKGANSIEISRLLFPTPALCGEPMIQAANLINSIEKRKRNLYGGVLGYINGEESAEFFVSIRCGFIDNNEATLFAGCGIVEGSDPDSEYEETNLKFIPLTSLFTDEN